VFTATKIFKIQIAHRLSLNKSECKNIHGHQLKIEIEIGREYLNENYMVIDYNDIKKIVMEYLSSLDHSLLLNVVDKDIGISICKKIKDQNITYLDQDPTSESMCYLLYHSLNKKFTEYDKNLIFKSITIWESDESKVKFKI